MYWSYLWEPKFKYFPLLTRVQFHSKLLKQEDEAKTKFKLDKILTVRDLTVVNYMKKIIIESNENIHPMIP